MNTLPPLHHRSWKIIASAVAIALVVIALAYISPRFLTGSILSDADIAVLLKERSDTDRDFVLTTREIRRGLSKVIRDVTLRAPAGDINGDDAINRTDITDAVRAFRAILAARCGNGAKEAGEQCDDGNQNDSDLCTNLCTSTGGPVCGNGRLDHSSEECDDTNTANGDGCSSTCMIELGYKCTGRPSVCTPLPQCSNFLDDDGDGGIDVPGALSVIHREAGVAIPYMQFPLTVQDFWYPIQTRLSKLLRIFDMRTGDEVLTLDPGDTVRLEIYDGKTNMLYLRRGGNDAVTGVKMNGTGSQVIGSVGPGGRYFYSSGPYIKSGGQTMYVLFREYNPPVLLNGPSLLYEVQTDTMQKTRELALPVFSSSGTNAFIYDDVRHRMYLLDQRIGPVGSFAQNSLIIREVDLNSMTLTGREKVIAGDRILTNETVISNGGDGKAAKILLDAEQGLLFLLQNPRSDNNYKTKIFTFSVEKFDIVDSLLLQDGSSERAIVTFEGKRYDKLFLGFLGLTPDHKIAATAYYGTGVDTNSRTLFMLFNASSHPTLLSMISDIPNVSTGSNPPHHNIFTFDPLRSVVYIITSLSAPLYDTNTSWMTINLNNSAVVRRGPRHIFQNPDVWAQFSRFTSDQNALLFMPAFYKGPSTGQFPHILPVVTINAGDASCSDAADDSEAL